MTGDETEDRQADRTVTNIVNGQVFGDLIQLGSVNGAIVFPEPKKSED